MIDKNILIGLGLGLALVYFYLNMNVKDKSLITLEKEYQELVNSNKYKVKSK